MQSAGSGGGVALNGARFPLLTKCIESHTHQICNMSLHFVANAQPICNTESALQRQKKILRQSKETM